MSLWLLPAYLGGHLLLRNNVSGYSADSAYHKAILQNRQCWEGRGTSSVKLDQLWLLKISRLIREGAPYWTQVGPEAIGGDGS